MTEDDRITEHAQETDHDGTGLAMFAQQFAGSDRLRALASSFLARVQQIEDALWALLTETDLDHAVGAQLDQAGRVQTELAAARHGQARPSSGRAIW